MAGETTTDPILSTKLHRPPVERNHIHRPHLSERLDQPRSKPLTLVSAPAGDEPQPSSFPNRFDSRSAFHLFVLIMILLLSAPLSTWAENTPKIELSPQEKAWLEANPELGRIAFQLRARVQLSAAEREWLTTKPKVPIRTGDYPPFHFDVDDIPKGLSVDYVKVICMAQNLDCHFVTGMAIADNRCL